MSILETVKMLLNITDDEQDGLLQVYVSMAEQSILNYCNLGDLPKELEFVAAQTVMEMHRLDHPKGGEMGVAQHVTEAGRTVIFGRAESASVEAARYQHILDSQTAQLQRFRKIRR